MYVYICVYVYICIHIYSAYICINVYVRTHPHICISQNSLVESSGELFRAISEDGDKPNLASLLA